MLLSVSTVLTNSFAGRLLPKARRRGKAAQLTLTIPNMHCEHCLESIKEAACTLGGVEGVRGDPGRQTVTVSYLEGITDPAGIRAAIIARGFRIADSAPAPTPVTVSGPHVGAGR
jgi:copper chaperone CopZ